VIRAQTDNPQVGLPARLARGLTVPALDDEGDGAPGAQGSQNDG